MSNILQYNYNILQFYISNFLENYIKEKNNSKFIFDKYI